jgi:hypothetical protein
MKNIFYIILMISTLFFLQACSEDEEVATTAASQTMTDSAGATVSLDGTYTLKCNGSSSFQKPEIVLSATNYTSTWPAFSDSDCDNATYTYITTATFAVGSATTTSGSDNSSKNDVAVTKIDYAIQSQTLTPKHADTVTSWNSAELYGFNDWAIDVAKTTWGLNDNGTTNATEVVGYKIYDIWYISGTSLIMGGGDVDTSKVYPTELDYSSIYVKQ